MVYLVLLLLYDCSFTMKSGGIHVGEAKWGRSLDVRFFRDFNDWELYLVTSFLNLLESNIPLREG